MRKIILTTSLFFCLAITTILAQVTPDGNTTTSTTSSGAVILINIAAPDTNGISNNTYSEFNVPASGVSLNNEHADNPNFAEGDLASIIVNQVTSSNPSLLEGLLSIQGGGASIIIANPNGITCNGCRLGASGYNVDLVTGTYNIATRTYDSISDNDITVGSGGLETTGVDLNIQTNNLTNSGHFTTSTVNLSLAGAFNNNGTIYVGRSFDESVDGFNITATDFTNSGTITVTHDNFNATVGTFSNESGATIVAPGGCNVVYITSYTDAGTSNCISSIVGVGNTIVIDIAEPNSNGLSDNQIVSFDVNARGTILNNSAGGGTAQFGSTTVTANSNITAGSEASLILLQVTGSTGSVLNGTIEVFGDEAGLIIANPNGITCDECAFINANRLDLVTGNNYNANTNTFGFIAAADIDIASSGLDASSVGILNISAGNFNNAGAINANNLNITAGADFSNSATINSDTITIEVTNFANDIENTGTISSASLNFILTNDFTHGSTSFSGFNNFSNLAITTEGTFTNNNAIDLAGNITITANRFINSNSVTAADNLSVVVSDNFNNSASTLKADNVDIQATNYILNSSNGMIEATDNLNIVTTTLFNVASGAKLINGNVGGNITAANLTIETGAFNNINNDGDINGNINATSFNLSVAGDFDYADKGTITTTNAFNFNVDGNFSKNDSASNFTWVANDTLTVVGTANIVAADFANSGTITTNSIFDITATNFTNTGTISANTTLNTTVTSTTGGFNNTGGVVSADTFSLSVAGDFNYITEYLGNGTINNNALNLNVGGNFSNNDANNDFTWNANDTLTVLGTANIVAADFNNSGTITVTNSSFDITATDFTNNGTISANTTLNTTVTSTVSGSFTNTGGEISATDFALSVVAGDFDYIAEYLNNGTITTNTLNLNVGGDFSYNDSASNLDWGDSDILTVSGTANIVAAGFNNSGTISADALTLSVAGDFDYIADYANGTITTNVFNLNVGGDFTFSESANNFIWRANDTLTVSGTANITAASFNNSGTIDVDNSFNATVGTFINESGATITAFGECNIVATTSSDNGTINCLDFAIEAMVFNIATPNSNGLSDNQVDIFDVSTDGTILNNSAVGGTAQFRSTDVEGNSNITAGSEASLILFQVTGSTVSALNGTLEVFGGEAGLIIANPNGIVCTGCAFINANRLDLVTGNYDADTNTFGDIAATNITLGGSSLELDVLNIQTGANFNNAGSINTDNLNITAGADFNNAGSINTDNLNITAGDNFNNSATINADTVTIEVTNFANDITNTSTVSSTSLNFILTANFSHSSTSLSGFNFSNLAISTDGTFTNTATINPTGNFTITANTFNNTGGVVNVDTFALSVVGNFDYKGTITANTSNLNVGGNFSYNDSASNFTWGANDNLTVTGNANITTNNYTQSGAITVDGDWTINAASDFLYNRPNNNLSWDTNDSLTVSGTASIGVAGFANSGTISVTNNSLNLTSNTFSNAGGEIDADTFNLDVAGDFDYIADKGNLTTNALNLDVGGNFSYDDAANNLDWRATDTLTVSGNASIEAASFNNSGTINVTNIFDIIAAADFNNSGTITVTNSFDITAAADFANSGTINVTNSFDITAADFANSGIINATNIFDITATNFTNTSTISANSFNAIVDSFINQSGATITAGECNLVVHTSSSDNGTITCLNSEGDAEVVDIATPFNGLSRNDYTDFNIPINGVVFNNSDSDATSQLLGDISKNPNINSGNAASIILAQVSGTNSLLFGALEVVGAEAVVIIANPNGISCNGCSFINASRVDLVTGSDYNRTNDNFDNIANTNITIIEDGLDASSVGILNIHAGSFTNTGVLQANTFNLFVDDFDYTEKGIINATIFNLEVDDVFSYEDESIGFVWEENDTLTVLGTANITTNNFINHGTIDITGSGSFEIITDYTAINQGSIVSENGSLNITTYDFFRNLTGGDIAVNTLNIIAGGKVTNTATIDVGTLSITASDDSSRTNDRTGFYVSNRGNIIATNLNITAVDNFYNRGNITATNFNITRAKDIFFFNKEIDSYDGTYDGGNISLNGDSSFRADGDIIENYGNIISLNGDSSFIADGGSIQNYGHIDFGSNNLDISADSFTNHEGANVAADTVNLNISSYINDGTIDAVVINNGGIIDTTSDTTNDQ